MNARDQPANAHEKIHTYTELRQQIHDDLRIQHPEWVEPNGQSPICDFYEARLMELLHSNAKGLTETGQQQTEMCKPKSHSAWRKMRFDHVASVIVNANHGIM